MKKRVSWRVVRIIAAAVFLAVAVASFTGLAGMGAMLLHVQFGPALLKLIAAFSAGTLATVLGIVLVTYLFGRFYCAVFCPLGILQDVIGFLSRRKAVETRNFAWFRYAVAGVVFGMLAFGWTAGFFLLDPYSGFGLIVASFSLGSLVPLAVIAILAVWKKRIYCTAVCPVGTLLGLIAKHGVFQLRITGKCVRCGKCVAQCPSGCIDLDTGTIDNERCVRCMNCLSRCPLHGIHLVRPERGSVPVDVSRRAFLIGGGALIAGLAAGAVLAKAGMRKFAEFAGRFRILPPGAGNAVRFASRCTGCQLCTANCPTGIIRPAEYGAGPVSLDFSRGSCRFDCNRCSQVCPTGAIRPLTLNEKQRTRIAEVHFIPQNCIVFQDGEQCGKCAGVCPVKAITLRRTGAPRVTPSLCIGCGACREVCPAPEKALEIREIAEQTLFRS